MLSNLSASRVEQARAPQTVCPYCATPSKFHGQTIDSNRHVSDEQWLLHACTECGLVFVANPPTDLSRFYTNDYHPPSSKVLEDYDPFNLNKYRVSLVQRYQKSGRLLDVGASSGVFARLAKRAGFGVSAIEMDQACVDILRDKLGIRAIQSADPAKVIAKEGRTYDVITLWHSIEHMREPWTVLDQCAQHLSPRGLLVLATPNPDALQAKFMGSRWPHYDSPRHLNLLPMDWIRSYADSRKLKVELITSRDRTSYFLGIGSWRTTTTDLTSRPALKSLLKPAGLAIGAIASLFELRQGYGAAYTAVLRRT